MLSFKYIISKLLKKIFIASIKNSRLHKKTKVCSYSNIVYTTIERYSYIGSYCTVVNAQIGSFCSIADNCVIGGAMHPINWVSTSPVFCDGKNILSINFSKHSFEVSKKTIIGHDVWIGNHCLIKQGVKIGNGAIIGMGAVVTKDVLPYSIVGGNPATLIRMRFDDYKISQLEKIDWFNFDDFTLIEQGRFFNNVDEFIKYNYDRFSDKRAY